MYLHLDSLSALRVGKSLNSEALRELPGAIKVLSEQVADGNLRITMESPDLDTIKRLLAQQQRQRFLIGLGAAAIISGTLIVLLSPVAWPGWIVGAGGMVVILRGRPGP